ncbi:hypothetical protein [Pontibacter cellulosilyticus]|uniref:STAS/SEC14 domain-containing protein n=1 Tax=Pontibacter cellulosilyticus TaxID=1720253 RepID=A0A923N6G4_9BACT|nr:hypothetical protein [Pontibacter cellulosilyticus]MBC5992607.1 hypothetical protein [Pontibacter cellulosilyticus]
MSIADNSDTACEEVLQNDYVSVLYDKANTLIIIKWKRQINFEERKELFMWGYQFSIDNRVKNWLIDDEEIFMFTQQEIDWVENIWTELSSVAGIQKLAVYTPDRFHTLSTMTNFTLQAQKNYKRHGHTEHEVFTDYQEALDWLTRKVDHH